VTADWAGATRSSDITDEEDNDANQREMETYVEETAGNVLDRGGEALRRADDFLQDTKAHVSETLRAGQADSAVKPVPLSVLFRAARGGAVVRS
jgi:hypothetical protein